MFLGTYTWLICGLVVIRGEHPYIYIIGNELKYDLLESLANVGIKICSQKCIQNCYCRSLGFNAATLTCFVLKRHFKKTESRGGLVIIPKSLIQVGRINSVRDVYVCEIDLFAHWSIYLILVSSENKCFLFITGILWCTIYAHMHRFCFFTFDVGLWITYYFIDGTNKSREDACGKRRLTGAMVRLADVADRCLRIPVA